MNIATKKESSTSFSSPSDEELCPNTTSMKNKGIDIISGGGAVDEEGGKAQTTPSIIHRPPLNGDGDDVFVDGKDDDQKRHQDVKACPFPFSCFNSIDSFRQETNDANGVVFLECAKSIAFISNVFYTAGLLYLAQKSSVKLCEDHKSRGLDLSTSGGSTSTCVNDGKILGFDPVSLVTNMYTISGVLSALFLPYIGSILDHTRYRWEVGLAVSVSIVLIQAAEVATNEKTWLAMTFVEAINTCMSQINLLISAAYMTEVKEQVTVDKFSKINTVKFLSGFINPLGLLIIIVAAGYVWGFDDQHMAQFSQAIGSVIMCVYFYVSWHFLGKRGPARAVPNGENLATAGFNQMFRTGMGLVQHYKRSVFLFFIGSCFTNAGIEGLLLIIVTYLKVSLLLESIQIAIILVISLVASIPGCICAHWLASKFTPIAALKFTIIIAIISNICVFEWLNEHMFLEACISAIGWGFVFGMYHPLLHLVYSMIVPKGQEAELGGFFIYSTVVLSWVLPLGATILNEYSNLKWSGALFSGCMFIGLLFISFMLPWSDCIDAAKVNLILTTNGL
jgi:MFS-type transporter involved in bile tolerance (Atg22 family)